MSRAASQAYKDLLEVWGRLANGLQKTYIVLGCIATTLSLAVGTFTTELSPVGVKIVSFLLALALGCITASDLGSKANGDRGAWRLLNAAVLAYENDDTYSIQDLYKQYLAGEAMLGEVKYNAPSEKPAHPGSG